ncbi:MAG: hypothetical protein ABJ239_12350 [Erythrobacter sp.]
MVSNLFHESVEADAIGSIPGHRVSEGKERQGVYLVFGDGRVPEIGAIRTIVESIGEAFLSLEPGRVGEASFASSSTGDVTQSLSVQISRNGLVFDLVCRPDQSTAKLPSRLNRYDCAAEIDLSSAATLELLPGKHINQGAHALPIMRSFMELSRDMVQRLEGVDAVIWPPANSLIGRRYFDSSVSAWLQDGTFPPLGLVSFNEGEDGDFASKGLSYFIGQELSLAASLMDDPASPNGLCSRLVNQLILSGAVGEPQAMVAPDGRRLTLNASTDGTNIMVHPG